MELTLANLAKTLHQDPQSLLGELAKRGQKGWDLQSPITPQDYARLMRLPKQSLPVTPENQEKAVDNLEEERLAAERHKRIKSEEKKQLREEEKKNSSGKPAVADTLVAEVSESADSKVRQSKSAKTGKATRETRRTPADSPPLRRKGETPSPKSSVKRFNVSDIQETEGDALTVLEDVGQRDTGRVGRFRPGTGRETPKVLQLPADRRQAFSKPASFSPRNILIRKNNKIVQLARDMSIKTGILENELGKLGVDFSEQNMSIDAETATLLIEILGHKPVTENRTGVDSLLEQLQKKRHNQLPRPPVVAVMGHVDHGKTTLLDKIRNARVADSEAGGITQHIGAWRTETAAGQMTFIDTPGHEAFSAMRALSANCTDIVILVVAADDGVMPQTKEVIEHVKKSGTPLVVAINKIDLEGADVERIHNGLASLGVVPEAWGGDVQFVNISAKNGDNLEQLLEAVVLQAEMNNLVAPTQGPAEGVVLESHLDVGRGPLLSLLVRSGQIRKGDYIVIDKFMGRVRSISDDLGRAVNEAGVSVPVQITGFAQLPSSGMAFHVVTNDKQGAELIRLREEEQDSQVVDVEKSFDVNEVFTQMENGSKQRELNIILKADSHGSLEAICSAIGRMGDEELSVRILSQGIGAVTESDLLLAADGALLLGFNVRAPTSVLKQIKAAGVKFTHYSVIYELLQEVEQALQGLSAPKMYEQTLGIAQVRQVFNASGFGLVAGCLVTSGKIINGNPIRVLRDNVVIFEGELDSLRRFKEPVNEVASGVECGIGVKNYQDIRTGDQIEVFKSLQLAAESDTGR